MGIQINGCARLFISPPRPPVSITSVSSPDDVVRLDRVGRAHPPQDRLEGSASGVPRTGYDVVTPIARSVHAGDPEAESPGLGRTYIVLQDNQSARGVRSLGH